MLFLKLNLLNKFFSFLIFFIFLLNGCNIPVKHKYYQSSNDSLINENLQDKELRIGNINIIYDDFLKRDYVIYLPKDTLKKLPILFILNPYGNNEYLVSFYQNLSDKYKVIFVALDKILVKNVNEIDSILYNIINFLSNYSFIDKELIYLLGIKNSSKIILDLSAKKRYKGFIAINPGFEKQLSWKDTLFTSVIISSFKFSNFINDYLNARTNHNVSFNYLSFFYDLDAILPPDTILEYGFLALFYNRVPLYEKNNFFNKWIIYLNTIPIRDNWKKTIYISSLYNLSFVCKYYDKNFNFLKNYCLDYKTRKQVKEIEESLINEKNELDDFVKDLRIKDTTYIFHEIFLRKKSLKKTYLSPKAYRDIRFLNFFQENLDSLIVNSLQDNDLFYAYKLLNIYKILDSINSNMYYLWSIYYAKNLESEKCLNNLRHAIRYGFSDYERIIQEKSFSFLRNNNEFQLILRRKSQKSK